MKNGRIVIDIRQDK